MSEHFDRFQMPFGWSQGDPCVVCENELHREYVQQAFKLRAHYILPLASVGGRRYNKVIVFSPYLPGDHETRRFERWVNESLRTCLPPNGEFYVV